MKEHYLNHLSRKRTRVVIRVVQMSNKPELRAEAIRLRVNQRLSLREIQKRIGASKGALSSWLRPYPLTAQEVSRKQSRGKRQPGTPGTEESKLYRQFTGIPLNQKQKSLIAESMVRARVHLLGLAAAFISQDAVISVRVNDAIVDVEAIPSWTRGRWGLHGRQLLGSIAAVYDFFSDTVYVYRADEVPRKTEMRLSKEDAEAWGKLMDGWRGGRDSNPRPSP
jgi:hypothetical protein